MSVALCDTRALSSSNNNSLMTIRLVLHGSSFQLYHIEQVGFPPSLDVYSSRGVFESHFQHRCHVSGEQCGRQHATLS